MAATTAEEFAAAAATLPMEGVPHHLSEDVDAVAAQQQQQEGGVVPQLLHDLQQQEATAWQMQGAVVDALGFAQTAAAAAAENVLEEAAAAGVHGNGAISVTVVSETTTTTLTPQQQQQDEEDQQQQTADEEDRQQAPDQQLGNSTTAAAAGAAPAATQAGTDGRTAAAGTRGAATAASPATNKPKEKEEKVLKFFVGGVYPQATELQIRSYFERYGKVKGVELKMDRVTGRNRGFAFVTMADETAKDAVFRGQHVLGGKKIEVRALHDDGYEALKRKIFVGGVNPSLSEEADQVLTYLLLTTHRSCVQIVEYDVLFSAESYPTEKSLTIAGCVSGSLLNGAFKEESRGGEEIGAYFGKFGTVEKVSIIRDATTGKSRGFGFVVFAEESAVKSVLKNRRHNLNDKDSCEVRAAEARAALPTTRRFTAYSSYPPMHPPAPGGRGGAAAGGLIGGGPAPAPVLPPSYFPAPAHPAAASGAPAAYYPAGRAPAAAPVAPAPAPAYYYGPPPPALSSVPAPAPAPAPQVTPYYTTAAPAAAAAAAPPVHPHMVGAAPAATPYAQHHPPQPVATQATQFGATTLTSTAIPMVAAGQQQTVAATNIYGTAAAPAPAATAYDPNAVAAAAGAAAPAAAPAAANARVAASSYWGEDQSAACYGVARTTTAAPAPATGVVARPTAQTAVTAPTSYGGYSPVRQSKNSRSYLEQHIFASSVS